MKEVIELILGFGIGYTCGAVLWFNTNPIFNKVMATITFIVWLWYAFKYL